jgi:hypothetical protein
MCFKLLSVVAQIARDRRRRPEFGDLRAAQNRSLVAEWVGLSFGDAAGPLASKSRVGRRSGAFTARCGSSVDFCHILDRRGMFN